MFFFNSSVNVSKSGILRGSIDCHCHLLPGVDDGVQTAEESLRIMQMMKDEGVKSVIFTPHIMEDCPNKPDNLNKVFLKHEWILPVKLAAEHMVDTGFEVNMPLPGNNVLFETSYFAKPVQFDEAIQSIRKAGCYPLLAHPCRYQYMDEEDYEKLFDQGVRFQLNIPVLSGFFGRTAQSKAMWMIDNKMYFATGTDTHSEIQYQRFLESKISRKYANKLSELISEVKLSD